MAPQFTKTIDGIDFKFNCPLFPLEEYWELDYTYDGVNYTTHRLIKDSNDTSGQWKFAANGNIPPDVELLELQLCDAIFDNQ